MNDAPIATDVAIDPSVPLFNNNLVLSYNYFDLEGDDESGTTIAWFKDGVEQEVFADSLTIPASATACDEEWYAEVIPYDGEVYGDTVASNTVDICGENDPPVWVDIPDQNINENSGDNILSMEGLIEDESLALLEFNVESNSDAVHLGAYFFEGSSDLILTTLVEDYNTLDPITLSLTASDGEYADTTDLYVYIDPVNYAPVLVVIADTSTLEDVPLTIPISASDADGDTLSFTAESDNDNVTVFMADSSLILTPADNWFGSVIISVTVSDGDLEDSEIFYLTVISVNDAPTIELPESFTFAEDGFLTEDFSDYIEDMDGDILLLTVSGNEEILVDINGYMVTFTAPVNWNGTETLTFYVEDESGETAFDSVSVVVTPVNDTPFNIGCRKQDYLSCILTGSLWTNIC